MIGKGSLHLSKARIELVLTCRSFKKVISCIALKLKIIVIEDRSIYEEHRVKEADHDEDVE